MSRRIHLPLTNGFASTATQLAAVEKHMRYMQSIGWEDGVQDGMVRTAAPSEPVLSIAPPIPYWTAAPDILTSLKTSWLSRAPSY